MPLIASYEPRESFIFKLDPRTKMIWLAGLLALAISMNRAILLAGLIVIMLAVSWTAGIDLKRFVPVTKVVGSFAVAIVLVQTVFYGGGAVFFRWGPLELHIDGFWLGVHVVLRLYSFILAFTQFLMWTHPTDLSLVLVKSKIPYRYALLMGIALRFLPVLEAELDSILAAQEARGLELRNPVRRGLNLIPIGMPFLLRTLRRTNEVALAMELKGYGYRDQRTFLRAIRVGPADYLIAASVLILVISYLAAGVLGFPYQ